MIESLEVSFSEVVGDMLHHLEIDEPGDLSRIK